MAKTRLETWMRRRGEWPGTVYCPLPWCRGVARYDGVSAAGITYKCTDCKVVFRLPVAQVDRKTIRRALRLGPIPE